MVDDNMVLRVGARNYLYLVWFSPTPFVASLPSNSLPPPSPSLDKWSMSYPATNPGRTLCTRIADTAAQQRFHETGYLRISPLFAVVFCLMSDLNDVFMGMGIACAHLFGMCRSAHQTPQHPCCYGLMPACATSSPFTRL